MRCLTWALYILFVKKPSWCEVSTAYVCPSGQVPAGHQGKVIMLEVKVNAWW